jgi:hypothetical protein
VQPRQAHALGAQRRGQAPAENPKSDLLDLLGDLVQTLRDGHVDPQERQDLLGQIGDLIRQLAGGADGPTVTPQPVGPPVAAQPQPAPSVAAGEPAPAGAGSVSNGPTERPQQPTSQIPETPDRAQAQSVRPGDADPALAAQRSSAGSPDSQSEATATTAKPAEAEATTSTTTAAKVEGPAPVQNDKVLAGVLSLLGDILTAQKDGQLDNGERQQLLTDLTKLVQSLVGEPTPQTGGVDPKPASGTGSSSAASPEPQGARMHDAVWFLEKTGLANFLSGFFSNGNNQLNNMVMQTLRSTEPKANA